jgi:hypothetical protein
LSQESQISSSTLATVSHTLCFHCIVLYSFGLTKYVKAHSLLPSIHYLPCLCHQTLTYPLLPPSFFSHMPIWSLVLPRTVSKNRFCQSFITCLALPCTCPLFPRFSFITGQHGRSFGRAPSAIPNSHSP